MNRSILSKIALVFILCATPFYVLAYDKTDLEPNMLQQAQDPLKIRVTINVKNATATTFFNELKKSSNGKVSFVYAESDFATIKDITINVTNVTVEDVLKKLVAAHPSLKYSVENNIITIKRVVTPPQKQQSQVGRVTYIGEVLNDQKRAVEGATILLKGTSTGAISDGKGSFTLSASAGQEIEVSCVGMITKTVTLGSAKLPLTITLKADALAIDEVQVVAYGTTTKRETTGSMTTIKADDIKGIPTSSVSNLLQGRVAGMDVTNITGAPGGGGTQVTIRGYNSLSVESGRRFSNPLWVIDGVPMNTFTSPVTGTNGLADLNPETIETIQILKDASATSLYGSRAANGVILVTTKKGYKNQDAQFSVNVSQSFSILPEYPTVYGGRGERNHRIASLRNLRGRFYDTELGKWRYINSYEDAYVNGYDYDYYWKDGTTSGGNGDELQDSLNSFYNNSTDFFKYYFQTGKITNANIQTYGGGERMTYSIGGGYYGEDGILKGTAFDRVNLMGNFSVLPTKFLTVDFRTALTYSDRSRGKKDKGFGGSSEIETIPGDPFRLSTLYPGNADVLSKAIRELNTTQEKNNSFRLRSSFGLRVDILKNLYVTNTTSLEYSQNNRNFFSPSSLDDLKHSSTTGEISRDMMLLNETVINYGLKFDSGHNFDVMLGHSYQHDTYNYNAGSAANGPSDLVYYATQYGWPDYYEDENGETVVLKNYQSDFSEKKMASLFGRINYNYKQKYIATVTVRRDGSSVFGSNVRWATFPSFAAAWNFSEESFMKGAKFINFGKIRASYGWSGNQFNNPYLAYGILQGSLSFNGQPAIAPNWGEGYYNPDLTWEETKQFDVGIDLTMANNRLTFTADYYNRITDQMLIKSGIVGNYNGYLSMWRNGAALSNDGLEFEIKYDIFSSDKAYWNVSLNFAKNWNKFYKSYNNRDISVTTVTNDRSSYILGKSVGEIRGYKTNGYIQSDNDVIYNWSEDGKLEPVGNSRPGTYNIVDVDGNGSIGGGDAVYLGSSIPTLYGGIVTEARYKNFDINVLFSYSLGRNMVYTGASSSIPTLISGGAPIFENLGNVSFWEKEGDNSTYSINAMEVSIPITDRMVQKVNYIKLKTLTLGYTIPREITKKIYLKEVRAFFSAENLFTITNYKGGSDPETVDINTGIDQGNTYPLARKFSIGLTVKF